jgi:hypothetical protein
VANYRGAIDRYILPNLGRAKVGEVDAATLDILYAQVLGASGPGGNANVFLRLDCSTAPTTEWSRSR